jgi:ATP-binding cassette, subfamily B, bacterial
MVGPSGAGKSTLLQLLLGLREPDAGAVLVNGQPMTSFTRADRARRIAFVPQEPILITGSIAENIRFFRDWVTDADIDRAAQESVLSGLIADRPDGLGTSVGEGGMLLSAGQRQRICIARALAGGPDLLVLDEPTSALDPISEAAIQQTIDALRGRCAVAVVAHRLNTLNACDRVVVLHNGEVRATGSPAELRESSPYFREAAASLLGASAMPDA